MDDGRRRRLRVLVVREAGLHLLSDAIARALMAEPSVRLISAPLTLEEAPDVCRRQHPDAVLLEATGVSDPELRACVRSIVASCDGAPVVLLADAVVDDEFLVASIEAGASSVVEGTAEIDQVVLAVQAAAAGRRLVDPDRFLIAVETTARAREAERRRVLRLGRLTDREREILAYLAEGSRNSEIAGKLSISPRTVDKHIEHILHKLEARSRLQAVASAIDMGDLAKDLVRGTT